MLYTHRKDIVEDIAVHHTKLVDSVETEKQNSPKTPLGGLRRRCVEQADNLKVAVNN